MPALCDAGTSGPTAMCCSILTRPLLLMLLPLLLLLLLLHTVPLPAGRCTLGEAVEWVEASAAQAAGGGGGPLLRGEFVVMVEGAGQAQAGVADEEAVKQALEELLEAGTSVSVSARQVSEMLGLPKSGVYATALALDKARRGRSGEGGGGSGR